jgi:7-cyano-7-deazaguanine synthase in queuosine biosynthesis
MLRSLVLCDGGLKSLFLTAMAKKEGTVVLAYLDFMDTGDHRVPIETIQDIGQLYHSPVVIHPVSGFPKNLDPLLQLLCFIFHGIEIARQTQCQIVYHGLSQEAVSKFGGRISAENFLSRLLQLTLLAQQKHDVTGNWLTEIEIELPLRKLHREHVIRLGTEWNVPWIASYDCQQGQTYPCGECPACLTRLRAFKTAGIEDPVTYVQMKGK